MDINDAIDAFDKHGLKSQNERNLDTTQVIQFLNRLFQPAVKQNSQLIDLVLAVDLTLNWLLCVYDQYVFSFLFMFLLDTFKNKISNNLSSIFTVLWDLINFEGFYNFYFRNNEKINLATYKLRLLFQNLIS